MTIPTSPIPLRRLAVLFSATAALLVPATAHAAQPAPTLEVGVADNAITVDGVEQLRPGPVRLHLSGEALTETRTIAIAELRPGATARITEDRLDRLAKSARLVAGANVSPDRDYATTITVRARRYAIVDVTGEAGGEARFAASGKPSGARPPRSDAAIDIRDTGFELPSSLPADGVLRIANRGRLPHQVTAFRLRASISVAEARRLVIQGRSLERLGTSTVLNGLVAPGAVNRVETHLRRGRYLVVSLYAPLTRDGRPDLLRGLVGATRVR